MSTRLRSKQVSRQEYALTSRIPAGVFVVSKYLQSYKDFPPSQPPASFTIDQAMEKLKERFNR